jgi:hypothetical protein
MGLPKKLMLLAVRQAAMTIGEYVGTVLGEQAATWMQERLGVAQKVTDEELAQIARRKARGGKRGS